MDKHVANTAEDLRLQNERQGTGGSSPAPLGEPLDGVGASPSVPDAIQPEAPVGQVAGATEQIQAQPPAQAPGLTGSARWIDDLNQAFGFSVGWKLKTGQLLIRAKKELPYGAAAELRAQENKS